MTSTLVYVPRVWVGCSSPSTALQHTLYFHIVVGGHHMILITFLRLMRAAWRDARRQQQMAKVRYPNLSWED